VPSWRVRAGIHLNLRDSNWWEQMIFVLINALIIVVVGALLFYLIDRLCGTAD
jgi:hypothetical protein